MRPGRALRTTLASSRPWLLAVAIAFPHAAAAQTDVIGSGTAFFINTDGWLVTNAHVLEGCQRATVPALGETSDWVVDKQNDLAALKIAAAAGKPYLMLRAAPPRLGEDIAAFGYPLHGLLSDSVKVTTGNVNSLVGADNDTRYLQVSTPLQPGNSGGPIVDQNGAVVGVASAVLGSKFTQATGVSPQNVNFAVHANILELFLRSRSILHEKASEAGAPLSTADLAERTTPAVVQILCHGTLPAVAAEPVPLPTAPAACRQCLFQEVARLVSTADIRREAVVRRRSSGRRSWVTSSGSREWALPRFDHSASNQTFGRLANGRATALLIAPSRPG